MKSNPWRRNYPQNPKLPHEHSLSGFPSQNMQETGVPSNSRQNNTYNDKTPDRKLDDSKAIKKSCILL